MCDPETLQTFLGRHGFGAIKKLGQHFLISRHVVNAIVGGAEGMAGICEIGPGPGVLTQPLSESAERLIALELDARMPALLAESAPQAEVRSVDALKVDLRAVLGELPSPKALVSNMPYYISGPLLQRVADVGPYLDRAILMMQKEVAERVIAPPGSGDRGSLSVFMQTRFTIRALANAPATAFFPPPQVDSKVLLFTPREPHGGPSEFYDRLVRFGFTQPRKTLTNNLVSGLRRPREEIVDVLESIGRWEKTRAQELPEEDWWLLAERLQPTS